MRISFKYKIQGAVLLILIVTLGCYIGLASDSLKKEKIASLLETTSANTEVISSRISRKLIAQEFWIESLIGQENIKDAVEKKTESLLAIVRKSNEKTERLFERAGDGSVLNPPDAPPKGLSFFARPENSSFWIVKTFENGESIASLWSADLLSEEQKNYAEGFLFLIGTTDQKVISINLKKNQGAFLETEFKKGPLPTNLSSKRIEANGENYILSSNIVEYFPLVIAVAVPESLALETVKTLQKRSLYFAIFVIGLTSLLSIWIGRALTQKLTLLTQATERISKGDLDSAKPLQANDEIGDLSKSIVAMAKDLKKYISEVSEKSRMEAELKTAKTVQEMLFPKQNWSDSNFEIHGYYECATECGGDLWFYWKCENYLFFLIADATGHGAPAALITSAARATIAGIEHRKETKIDFVAEVLHESVKEVSKGEILMTAWIGRLDLANGEVQSVNCSHEVPFLIQKGGDCKVLTGSNNPRLGDKSSVSQKFEVDSFVLQIGERLCLYTDGLSDIQTKEGTRYSDRKFLSLFVKSFSGAETISEGTSLLVKTLKDYSEDQPLEDDLTMLVLGRKS